MRAPFRLIATQKESTETVECLRALLKEAEAGHLIGVAYVSMFRRRDWDFRVCGEAARNKTWTAGMLQAFSVKLARDIIDAD